MTDRDVLIQELRRSQDSVPDLEASRRHAAKLEEIGRLTETNRIARERMAAVTGNLSEIARLADTIDNHRTCVAEALSLLPVRDPGDMASLAVTLALESPQRVRAAVDALAAADPQRMNSVMALLAAAGDRAQETAGLLGIVEPARMREVAARLGHPPAARLDDPTVEKTSGIPVAEPASGEGHAGIPTGLVPTIKAWGGAKATAQRALGLLLRDGVSGLRAGLSAPPAEASRPAQPAPAAARHPEWYSEETPEVSIIVLNYNKAHLALECVRSLWHHTAGHTYEIVVVDNGSSPGDYAVFAGLDGPCRLVRLDTNRYFGEGNNIGVEAAKGEFVVLMNNDVTVREGWLQPLMARITGTPDCGAVGPKFLYPNGLLQEAGGLLGEEGLSVQIGKYQDPELPEFNVPRIVDYVSAACLLVRKEDFVRVRGFDMKYEPAYYEDADLCLKLSRLGLSTYYAPDSAIVHHESATTKDALQEFNLSNLGEINRRKMLEGFGGYLRTGRHAPLPPPLPALTCAERPGKRTAAFFLADDLTPTGTVRLALGWAEAMLAAGMRVELVTRTAYSRMRVAALADTLGLDLGGLCVTTQRQARRRDLVDEFIAVSEELVPPVEPLGRRNTFVCRFPDDGSTQASPVSQPHLAAYDRVLVDSVTAASTVRELLRASGQAMPPMEVLPPRIRFPEGRYDEPRSGVLSVGRFATGPASNRQDLQIAAFRRLVEGGAAAGVTLHLVGSTTAAPDHRQFLIDCAGAAEGLDVRFHVNASAHEIDALSRSCSLFWGTRGLDATASGPRRGLGGAPIEAMAAGLIPVVAVDPEGLIREGVDGYHRSSMAEFVDLSARLLAAGEDSLDPMRRSAVARALALREVAEAAVVDGFGLRAAD